MKKNINEVLDFDQAYEIQEILTGIYDNHIRDLGKDEDAKLAGSIIEVFSKLNGIEMIKGLGKFGVSKGVSKIKEFSSNQIKMLNYDSDLSNTVNQRVKLDEFNGIVGYKSLKKLGCHYKDVVKAVNKTISLQQESSAHFKKAVGVSDIEKEPRKIAVDYVRKANAFLRNV